MDDETVTIKVAGVLPIEVPPELVADRIRCATVSDRRTGQVLVLLAIGDTWRAVLDPKAAALLGEALTMEAAYARAVQAGPQ